MLKIFGNYSIPESEQHKLSLAYELQSKYFHALHKDSCWNLGSKTTAASRRLGSRYQVQNVKY